MTSISPWIVDIILDIAVVLRNGAIGVEAICVYIDVYVGLLACIYILLSADFFALDSVLIQLTAVVSSYNTFFASYGYVDHT